MKAWYTGSVSLQYYEPESQNHSEYCLASQKYFHDKWRDQAEVCCKHRNLNTDSLLKDFFWGYLLGCVYFVLLWIIFYSKYYILL